MLVEVSHGEVEINGLANMRSLGDNYCAEFGVEMYINLDHSPSVEAAKAGIDAGFEFIHIDYSQAKHGATDAETVAATREVVRYAAQTTGALVESEPHYFGSSSNLHTEDIDYAEIRTRFCTPAPRGSASARSISTPTCVTPTARLEAQLAAHPDEYAIVKLIEPVIAAVQDVVEQHIDLFGSQLKRRLPSNSVRIASTSPPPTPQSAGTNRVPIKGRLVSRKTSGCTHGAAP